MSTRRIQPLAMSMLWAAVGALHDAAAAAEPMGGGATHSGLPGFIQRCVEYNIAGYELWRVAAAIGILILALAVNTILRNYLKRYRDKMDSAEEGEQKSFPGLLIGCLQRPLRVAVWAGAIRLLGPVLAPDQVAGAIWLTTTMLSVALAVFIYEFVDIAEYYLMKYAQNTDTKLDDMLVPVLRKAMRVLVVIVASLHIYQSITNQSISTILAGLGLGGLAFALAAQDTIRNLFGFAMIVLDRPFVVGERINFDGHDGVVESVGLRSTRMRRLDGHVVTIPNSKAADAVIHNIGRRPYIRRIMNIGLTYDTPPDKVEKAVEIVRGIFQDHEGMDPEFPPRVYFNEFNADNLNIIVIYWYHPPLYWDYLAHCQRVNLEIMRSFEAEGIDFAFPTQTLYLAGDPARELVLRHEISPEQFAGMAGAGPIVDQSAGTSK